MTAKWQPVKSAKQWDDFVTAQPNTNFLLAWAWGVCHKNQGKQVFCRGLYHHKKLQAVYTAVLENSRRGRYLALSGSPLLADPTDEAVWRSFSQDVRSLGRANNICFVRMRPPILVSDDVCQTLHQNRWRRAPIHMSVEHAGVLDLKPTVDDLFSHFSRSLRRNIRRATKKGVVVNRLTDLEAAQRFCRIHQQHSQQRDYVPFTNQAIIEQFKAFLPADQVVIHESKQQDRVLAMQMTFFFGNEASYHYAVSTPAGRQLSTAGLLNFTAIKEAKQRGFRYYNFWGIVRPDQTKHSLWGVSQFKRSFNIVEWHYIRAHDLVLQPVRYLPVWLFETARRWHRRV